jgi:cytochrome b6-f complex iron-sulfur subunit
MEPKTRREFCVHACQAASLATLASLLEGCGGSSPTGPDGGGGPVTAPPLPIVSGSVNNRVVSLTVDAASPLAGVGSAALVSTSSGNFLVAHTGQTTFVALTAICTHEACTVTLFENSNYVCPCHGSTYSTSGAVLGGPAPRALQQFPTQFNNNVVTFNI